MNLLRPLFGPVKRTLRTLGYDVVRAPSDRWLRDLGINTVIDVGANSGQFAARARRLFPKATIYSFEPIDKCYRTLVSNFSHDRNFRAFPFALGSTTGTASFHRSNYSPSSSLLEMADLHRRSFPYSAGGTTTPIEVRRLDDLAAILTLNSPILVKLDVQGYEDKVIDGAASVLRLAKVLITEVSFAALYVDQPLFESIYDMLTSQGFAYRGNLEQLRSPIDGRILQADAVFVRPDGG